MTTDVATGQLHVKFEDLQNGGDQNFYDANFTVDIGTTNAALMAHEHTPSAHAASRDDTLVGGTGNDKLYGGSGDDILDGGAGTNVINAGSGDDRIYSGQGSDTIVGGSGFDTLDFSRSGVRISVDLHKHITLNGYGSDTVSGVEAVIGTNFGDSLVGDKRANVLDGGAGNDLIVGGKGADVLIGGAGDDVFAWTKSDIGTGVDHIKDFSKGDRLYLTEELSGTKGTLADKVQLVDDVAGSHLMAKVGGSFVEVAMLDGVHNTSAADLLKAGMLLV